MKNWSPSDWAHHDFLISLSKLFEREGKEYTYYDCWWLLHESMFDNIEIAYMNSNRLEY